MQLNLALNTWGGKRRGAGRPASRYRSSELHVARERFERVTPFHVTLRAVEDVRGFRTPGVYHAVRSALETANRRDGFAIVHASIQDNHLHLISEATTDRVLSRGMQAFEISAARRINSALGRSGQLFGDRYHPVAIESPTQALHSITYVLNNWRRHGRDAGMPWLVDYYSSGPSFDGWKEHGAVAVPTGYRALPVARTRTWLLAVGWKRAGDISLHAVPGGARR